MQWFVWIILAAVLTAFHNIVRKRTLIKEHATEFLTIFSIIAFLLLLPFLKFANFHLSGMAWMLLYIDGLLLTGSFIFISRAYRHLDISEVSPLTNVSIIFVLIMSVLFLNESVTWPQLIGIFLILVGTYALEADPNFKDLWKPFRLMKNKVVRNIWIALGLSAVASILSKVLLTPSQVNLAIVPVEPFTFTFVTRMFVAINFFIILLVFYDGFKGITHGVKNAGWWILLSAAFFTAGTFMYYTAISFAFLTLVFSLGNIDTLITTLVGGELFHDKGLFQKALACIIIIAGSMLVII